jgi:hypothetical protein
MEPEFRFCLNGEVVRSIRVEHEMIDGEPIGKRRIAVEIEGIGWFTIDDNENLWDKDLPKFVLKYTTIPMEAGRLAEGHHNRIAGSFGVCGAHYGYS